MENKLSLCSLTDWEANENEYKHYLTDANNWNKIPCWKSVTLPPLMGQKLFRFTGMVQDMLNPEIYLQQYEVKDNVTQQSRIAVGKYRDIPVYTENETLVEDSVHTVNGERQTLYCISVPAMNSWVKQHHNRDNDQEMMVKLHRTWDNDGEMNYGAVRENKRSHPEDEPTTSAGSSSIPATESSAKRLCPTFQPPTPYARHDIELTLPVPDSQSVACLVKVYEEIKLNLNDVIEVVGFLSVTTESTENEEMELDQDSDFDNQPSSLIPRLHAVAIRKLQHCNPLLHPELDNAGDILAMANSVRQELKLVFSQALLGDDLAAEYMICHLISRVFQRSDMMSLGQLSLNLSKVPKIEGYCSKLNSLLEKMLTKSHYVPLTIDNLNKSNFIPRKDYKKNRLHSGMLQLSAGTRLVLDETCLEQGMLDSNGVHNVRALETLIVHQLVDYDFKYYNLKFNTDVSVLILSEGNSILPNDVAVPLDVDAKCLETMNEIFDAINHYLQEPVLEKIRKYITAVRLLDYTLPEDLEMVIQEDFVRSRRETGSRTSACDLHRKLVLARLTSLSRGEKILSRESWDLVCNMEQRRQRLPIRQRPS